MDRGRFYFRRCSFFSAQTFERLPPRMSRSRLFVAAQRCSNGLGREQSTEPAPPLRTQTLGSSPRKGPRRVDLERKSPCDRCRKNCVRFAGDSRDRRRTTCFDPFDAKRGTAPTSTSESQNVADKNVENPGGEKVKKSWRT